MTLLRWVFAALQPISPAASAWLAERLFFTARRTRLSAGARAMQASGRRFTLRVEGRRVVGWRWGPGAAPVIYLVHGWGSRGVRLASFVEPLVALGYAVVTYDAPGNGASGRGMTSMPDYARALAAVVAHQGRDRVPEAIVGHSMGCAAIALALAWGLEARRLVFLAPAADPPAWVLPFAQLLGLRPEVIERVRVRSQRRLRVRWDALNVCDIARRIARPPLLIVHDERDDTVRYQDGVAIARAWPEARLITTSGLAHRGVTNDPGVVRQATEFLTQGSNLTESYALEWEMFYRADRPSATPYAAGIARWHDTKSVEFPG